LHIKCDITDPDAVNRAADEVRSKLGKPSILLNNAGILHSFPILDTPPEKLRKMFDINLISHWYTCKAFVPDMVKADKGHILTLASIASYITVPLNADYAASKAAVLSFHEGTKCRLRP
jgi:short-subunit dehydrogenase